MFTRSSQLRMLSAVLVISFLLICTAGMTASAAQLKTARPSVNGRLHVEGAQLTDTSGEAVQLRGVSTHGLTWYPDYINKGLFRQVSEDWNCNLVRLAMYASIYSGEGKEESLALMIRGIEAAVEADMYVLVDWHML